MLTISITPRAQEYIGSKGGSITVSMKKEITQFNCCGSGDIECPMVQTGRPPEGDMQQYCRVNEGNIELYIHIATRAVFESAEPYIDLDRTVFGKKLVMYGVQMDRP